MVEIITKTRRSIVLARLYCARSSSGINRLRDIPNINILEKTIWTKSILNFCQNCYTLKMASLPQGAFAACKLREMYRDQEIYQFSNNHSNDSSSDGGDKNDGKEMTEHKKPLEYGPVKYHEKLMNSIWGLYNRYSPHNIKSNDFEFNYNGYIVQQQDIAVASAAIAENFAMAMNSGMDWTFPEK